MKKYIHPFDWFWENYWPKIRATRDLSFESGELQEIVLSFNKEVLNNNYDRFYDVEDVYEYNKLLSEFIQNLKEFLSYEAELIGRPPKTNLIFLEGNDGDLLYYYYDPLTKSVIVDDHADEKMVNYRLISPLEYFDMDKYPFRIYKPFSIRWYVQLSMYRKDLIPLWFRMKMNIIKVIPFIRKRYYKKWVKKEAKENEFKW